MQSRYIRLRERERYLNSAEYKKEKKVATIIFLMLICEIGAIALWLN